MIMKGKISLIQPCSVGRVAFRSKQFQCLHWLQDYSLVKYELKFMGLLVNFYHKVKTDRVTKK